MAKMTKKTKKEINRNVLVAVAITSILVNMFFLIGVVTYASTSKFDEALLARATSRYCDDISEIKIPDQNVVPANSIPPAVLFSIVCRNGEFAPYYDQAVQEYLRDLGY